MFIRNCSEKFRPLVLHRYYPCTSNHRCITLGHCSAKAYKKDFKTNVCASNPLIDGPDFTFVDGRPTPLTIGQRNRILRQIDVNTRIINALKEIQFAKDQFRGQIESKHEERNKKIAEKLLPKGKVRI